jgi:hypothetical protein
LSVCAEFVQQRFGTAASIPATVRRAILAMHWVWLTTTAARINGLDFIPRGNGAIIVTDTGLIASTDVEVRLSSTLVPVVLQQDGPFKESQHATHQAHHHPRNDRRGGCPGPCNRRERD